MTPMSAVFDWLAVGDLGLEDSGTNPDPVLGGAAARLALHASALGAHVALVAKVGDDDLGRRAQELLRRTRVDLRWVRRVAGVRTTAYHEGVGRPGGWQVDRGADATLRLDELPSPSSAPAKLVVVSGYSLCVEPARSTALGALRTARARQARAALFLPAEQLWQTNARMTLRLVEPAIALAHTVALSQRDVSVLFGKPLEPREALRRLSELGPRLIYLAADDGAAWLRDGARAYRCDAPGGHQPRDRYAAPAAFWVELARATPSRKAADAAVAYAQSIRRPAALPALRP
ncbi:MAG: carbohydrate kinase family protein [Candidatus Dormibacteraeota bacterium]|nr:carbohydrate kinase family protein [Candidatus Dormibacteraeota bacterium]